jgi:hypothetical protein
MDDRSRRFGAIRPNSYHRQDIEAQYEYAYVGTALPRW